MVNHKRLGERGVNHPNRTRHMGLRTAIEHVGDIAKGTQDNLFINRFLLICRSERLDVLVELLSFFRKCSHDASLRFFRPAPLPAPSPSPGNVVKLPHLLSTRNGTQGAELDNK